LTESSGQLHFEVDAALLFELGEQLVGRRSIALAELVKNASDADARTVTLRFKSVTRAKGPSKSKMPAPVCRSQRARRMDARRHN